MGFFLFCSQWLKKMWWLCLSSAVVVSFIFFLEHETALCISLQPKKIRGKLTQMDFSFEKTCKSHNTKTYFELVQCSHTVLPAYVFLNLPVYRIWIGLLSKKYETEYHTIRFSFSCVGIFERLYQYTWISFDHYIKYGYLIYIYIVSTVKNVSESQCLLCSLQSD